MQPDRKAEAKLLCSLCARRRSLDLIPGNRRFSKHRNEYQFYALLNRSRVYINGAIPIKKVLKEA
jgi:hypothetical protein